VLDWTGLDRGLAWAGDVRLLLRRTGLDWASPVPIGLSLLGRDVTVRYMLDAPPAGRAEEKALALREVKEKGPGPQKGPFSRPRRRCTRERSRGGKEREREQKEYSVQG
jgi:hypothetical protein